MSDRSILRDEDIAAVFRRRAGRAEPDDLAHAVSRATAVTAQRRGWLQKLRPLRAATPGRLLLLAVLVLATAGAVVVAGAVARLVMVPTVPIVVSEFVRPFSYRAPEDVPVREASEGWVHIGNEPLSGEPPYAANLVAVDIVPIDAPQVHGCSGFRTAIRDDPAGFFADLGEVGGTVLVDQGAISISGRQAITATVKAACSADFHVGPGALSGYVPLRPGARLYALDVDGVSVVIVIWAGSPEALDRWLPSATRLVDSIRFDGDDR